MERVFDAGVGDTYHPASAGDRFAEQLNHVANEIQRPFWFCGQNVHRLAANPLHEEEVTKSVARRFFKGGIYVVGTCLGAFLAAIGFALKGISNRFHSRAFTYWEGQGNETRPEKPKSLHLNACMFPGGLPYVFGGVRPAGERMDQLRAYIGLLNPDIFFLCEFGQTLSGKLYETFQADYRHFFVNIGSNAQGLDASMTVVSREPILSQPKFFPSKSKPEGDQRAMYRGFFHVETEKVHYLYVHLHPKETARAKKIRQRQVDEIKKITEDHANGKPWVVLGDMNIKRGSAGHIAMLEKGFRDVIQEQHGNVETCINGFETGEKRNPESIDGIFVIGGNLEILTEIHDTDSNPRSALSDHRGMTAVIC